MSRGWRATRRGEWAVAIGIPVFVLACMGLAGWIEGWS